MIENMVISSDKTATSIMVSVTGWMKKGIVIRHHHGSQFD
jgi:hypothetical protein